METKKEACLWAHLLACASTLCWAPCLKASVKKQREGVRRVVCKHGHVNSYMISASYLFLASKTLVLLLWKIAKKYVWAACSISSTCQWCRQLKVHHQLTNNSSRSFETKNVISCQPIFIFKLVKFCSSVMKTGGLFLSNWVTLNCFWATEWLLVCGLVFTTFLLQRSLSVNILLDVLYLSC